jgi:hypothetical protein
MAGRVLASVLIQPNSLGRQIGQLRLKEDHAFA